MSRFAAALAAVLAVTVVLAPGCVISLGSHGSNSVRVGGVRLDERHEETLAVGHWTDAGLHVESTVGDVRVEPTDGENRIHVTVWEQEPGDAYAVLEDGQLVSRSRTDRRSAIGKVTVYTNSSLASLHISTGTGDIRVQGIPVENDIHMSSGTGDLHLCCAGEPGHVVLSTGTGDVTVGTTTCDHLEVSTGVGDVEIDEVTATQADFSTGLGDVELDASVFERVNASTGLGDIDCSETTYEKGDLSSGLGSVDRG